MACQWGVMARTRILGISALWPWPWRYDLGSRSWHILWSWTIISRSDKGLRSYGPDTMALEIWPWVKVMTHPLVMDNNCVKYYPDPTCQWRVMARTCIFCYVWTLTLTLEVWSWVMVLTHPLVMDNNCMKYYPDPIWQWWVMGLKGKWVECWDRRYWKWISGTIVSQELINILYCVCLLETRVSVETGALLVCFCLLTFKHFSHRRYHLIILNDNPIQKGPKERIQNHILYVQFECKKIKI